MTSFKIYVLSDSMDNNWCWGYFNGTHWRVCNKKSKTGWFTWVGEPFVSAEEFFKDARTVEVNNFKEKAKC